MKLPENLQAGEAEWSGITTMKLFPKPCRVDARALVPHAAEARRGADEAADDCPRHLKVTERLLCPLAVAHLVGVGALGELGVLVAVGASDAPEPKATVEIPRPDVVADLGVLAEAANRVNCILGPVRLGIDSRQDIVQGRAVGQRLDTPADAHDPVVEVVVDLLLMIDARLQRAQLRSPYSRRQNDVGHGRH